MKMVKSLLLGTAAGLVAMTGAQAADLPVKAKPVQYVKICSLYGAGFYYIPGTDTCLKVGGWVRAETDINSATGAVYKTAILDSRSLGFVSSRVRGVVTLDARSQTAYGTLRSYISGGWEWNDGAASSYGTGGTALTTTNGYFSRGFIQWAGLTAGHAQSFFDFFGGAGYSNMANVWGSDSGGTGENVLGYTAQLGNGLSATISAEDNVYRRNGLAGEPYDAVRWPDLVANLRVDQAWGSAQAMGAMHQIRATTAAIEGFGYAVGAGVTVNLPMLGKGDNISTQVTYAKGALDYVGSGIAAFSITNGGTVAKASVTDAAVIGGSLDMTAGWSVAAGFQHVWNANWKTSLYGSYGAIDYSVAAGNNDWSLWQVGSRTIWTPVANLDLSVDVMYNRLNTDPTGTADQGWWQGMFRIQRNFYP